ncbi:hypothetical protein RVBP17_0120 [Pseudomonas phage sp. 30-3]|nr:hypothetical protein RVBP17_0120 [Pseudomonas phage sp. 30-3]
MTKATVTVEQSAIKLVRRNLEGHRQALLLNGVEVGSSEAFYKTKTQRTWSAKIDANINGKDIVLEQKGVFSAIRIARSMEQAILFILTDGKEGAEMPASTLSKEEQAHNLVKAVVQVADHAVQSADKDSSDDWYAAPAKKGSSKKRKEAQPEA